MTEDVFPIKKGGFSIDRHVGLFEGRGIYFYWVVVSNIFYVHPENWGNDPI